MDGGSPIVEGSLVQVAYPVRDVDGAVRFFGEVLGLRLLYRFGELAFFDCGGVRLMVDGFPAAREHGVPVLYFRVRGIARAFERLRARGVGFLDSPHLVHRHADGTEEWMAFFWDPEGHVLALAEQVPPAESTG
jgi:methylmalonyl-CoA/ethylmalonyl-CoA epimerase